jgi:Malectin domain/F5/8 type C domain/Fibronectin type III domain
MKRATRFVPAVVGAVFAISVGVIACHRLGGDSDDSVEMRSAALDVAKLNVTMRSYDNARSGANLKETVLTQANVGQSQFGKVFQLNVDDQIYAQLLFAEDLTVGGNVRDVVFAATVNNSVYAFDSAAGGAPLWMKNYNGSGNPPNHTNVGVGPPYCTGGYNDMSGNVGIIGTPAIDPATDRMYFVTRHLAGGTYSQILRAIDVKTGNDAVAPKTITATIPGSGDGSTGGNLSFDPRNENQRPAIALAGGNVYIAWAGHCDTAPYHGWVMTYDATTLAQTGVFNTTPNGKAAGIWMSGGGPVIDGTGVYYSTGNGWGDMGNTQPGFGESLIRFFPVGSLTVASSFTAGNFASLNNADNDLGVGGMALVPGTSKIYTGSKGGGKGYLLNTTNLGGLVADDSQIPQVFNAVDTTVRPSNSHHNHATPVMWQSPQGLNTYIWAENDFMRAYRFNTGTQKYNTPAALVGTVLPPVGMPGGFMTISANGSTAGSGILWATTATTGDANHATVPGTLRAFNAETLAVLWDSTGPGNSMGNLAKYNPPLVALGSVYVPTFSNMINVYRNMATATPLPRSSWAITASNGQASTSNMKDGVTTTRWTSGMAMTNGMNFVIDMINTQGFNQIKMDSGGNANDYARGYQVLTGTDLATLTQVATGTGTSALITVNLPQQNARFIKVVQTGTATNYWSIVEFNAYTATPPPQPPSGLTATTASSSAINLAWTASPTPGVTYNVHRSTTSGFTPSTSNQIASGIPGLTYGDSGLVASTTYYYAVTASNSTGTSSPSNQANATTSAAAGQPQPPSGLTATVVSSSAINLSWTASGTSGVTYTVFRSTTSTFTPSENNDIAAGLTGTTYADSGLLGSTTYFYVVQAVTAAGASSASSNQASATTSGAGALSRTGWVATASNGTASAPLALDNNTGTRYTSGTGMIPGLWFQVDMTGARTFNQINMNSAASANDYARGYSVYVSNTNTDWATTTAVASGNGTAASITVQFATQTARYLRVVQTSNTPASWWSIAEFNVYGGATPPPPPGPPSGLTATATSSSNINLSWTASPTSGVTYSLFRSTSASFTPSGSSQIASGLGGLTYADSALSGSTTYYYYVQAVNGGVNSTSSNRANATTSVSSGTKINCGGAAVSPFVADVNFTGGTTINHANTIDLSGVTNPAPAAVYQTARTNTFSYTIPGFAASSSHTVRLHFCETYFSAAGSRTFNVSINGAQVLSAFDIFATAGAKNKAVIQEFTVSANASGSYVIQFTAVVNSGLISGIEIQ